MNKEQIEEQARLLKKGSPWDCYYFAMGVEGADIPALQARMLEAGKPLGGYYFVSNIKGAQS